MQNVPDIKSEFPFYFDAERRGILIQLNPAASCEEFFRLKISSNTIFNWRHKILASLSMINGNSFIGIVECDDKQFKINEKGSRKLDRKAYKRPSDRKTKRGISNDKLSVMVATDRKGNPLMKIAKMSRIDSDSVEKTIGFFISPNNILCSDSHPSIILWANNQRIRASHFCSL